MILVFTTEYVGHVPQYIDNIIYGTSINSNHIVIVHHSNCKLENLKANVNLISLSQLEEKGLKFFQISIFRRLLSFLILCKYLFRFKPERVVLINLFQFFPFILLLPTKLRVRGIIYNLHFYDWRNYSVIKKIKIYFLYLSLSKFRIIEKIFHLNNKKSPRFFNTIFKTNKHYFLPDPPPFYSSEKNLSLNRLTDKKTFIHFGGLVRRKGTLEILKGINKCCEKLNRVKFVFAGIVGLEIKDEFYECIKNLESKVDIEVYDYFLTVNELINLVKFSDFIIAPYEEVNQSSGLFGFSAITNTPVIMPNRGILNEIVLEYRLGLTLDFSNGVNISEILSINPPRIDGSRYLSECSLDNFFKSLIV